MDFSLSDIGVAVVAVIGAVIGAALSSWLGARTTVAQEMRDLRMQTYPILWKRTSVLSTWPQTDATYGHLRRLHEDLRTWYFATGGLSLSENARGRYGSLQQLIGAVVIHARKDDDEPITPDDYTALRESGSALRTAMTEDVESRGQRSVIRAVQHAVLHRRQARAAERRLFRITKERKSRGLSSALRALRHRMQARKMERLDEAGGEPAKPLAPIMHVITPDEEQMLSPVLAPPADAKKGPPAPGP